MSYTRRLFSINIHPVKQPQDVYPPIYRFDVTKRYTDGHEERGQIQGAIEIFMREYDKYIDLWSKKEVTDILRAQKQYELNQQYTGYYSANRPNPTVFGNNPNRAAGGYSSSANAGSGYTSSAQAPQVPQPGYTSRTFCK